MSELEGPRFITVDLEVWSKTDLALLAEALEARSFVLYVGKVAKAILAFLRCRAVAGPAGRVVTRAIKYWERQLQGRDT